MPTIKKYPIDVENVSEAGRLNRQGYSLDDWLGVIPEGVLPGARVLDLASGTGTWAINVARAHPECRVLGVDRSKHMTALATTQAQGHRLVNCTFQHLDIMEHPLNLPDGSFDLIHARLIFSFQTPTTWVPLFRECLRLLTSGGILISTEADAMLDYAPAAEKYLLLLYNKMRADGRLFPATGSHNGILPMQSWLMQQAGFLNIQRRLVGVDQSYGTPSYKDSIQDLLWLFKNLQPYLMKAPHASTQQELDNLLAQSKAELESSHYRALGLFQTVWGRKP